MGKIRMSMKQATMCADKVFSAGYCDLYYLTKGYEVGYNAGVYGWNCDIIYLWADGYRICITTGYRNMRGQLIPETLRKEYEERAKELTLTHPLRNADFIQQLESLQTEFARALLAL